MKFLGWISGLILTLVISIYVLAFTGFGNSLVKPIVENELQKVTKLDAKLSEFSLSSDNFNIILDLDSRNTIYISGNYSIFSKKFNVAYKLRLDKLENLQPLTNSKDIRGVFHTTGRINGDTKFITVDGISNVASSNTSYHIELTDFNPTSIIAKVKKADLAQLLYISGQKKYAQAKLNADINFKNIDPNKLDGDIKVITKDGRLNTQVMKDDFNITIPKTAFAMNLYAKLSGKNIDYKYKLKSNLANFNSLGRVIPQPLQTDIKYNLDVKELAVLKPITSADIRGALKLNGTVKGTKENMVILGYTDIASSKTSFKTILKEFQSKSITAKIQNLKVQKLLYMVKQPHYADALVDVNIDISDAKMGQLAGNILTNIKQGKVDTKFITKEYKFKHKMPKTLFKAKISTKLDKNMINSKITFNSTLADLYVKKAHFNLDDISLKSDYSLNIAKLEKLFFVTEKHILGGIKIDGELKKAKDLDFIAYSDIVGGKLEAKLHNDNINIDLKDIKTIELLHKLIYPEIFSASLDAKVNYDLAKNKGHMNGKLNNGKFTQNIAFDLAKEYAKINMYREGFKGDVKADINKEHIIASLDLQSRTSSIKTQNTKLNTKTNQIKSTINIDANGNEIIVKLSGDTTKPKVKVDASELVKAKAKKAIAKEIEKKFGDKLGGDVGNILKSFF